MTPPSGHSALADIGFVAVRYAAEIFVVTSTNSRLMTAAAALTHRAAAQRVSYAHVRYAHVSGRSTTVAPSPVNCIC